MDPRHRVALGAQVLRALRTFIAVAARGVAILGRVAHRRRTADLQAGRRPASRDGTSPTSAASCASRSTPTGRCITCCGRHATAVCGCGPAAGCWRRRRSPRCEVDVPYGQLRSAGRGRRGGDPGGRGPWSALSAGNSRPMLAMARRLVPQTAGVLAQHLTAAPPALRLSLRRKPANGWPRSPNQDHGVRDEEDRVRDGRCDTHRYQAEGDETTEEDVFAAPSRVCTDSAKPCQKCCRSTRATMSNSSPISRARPCASTQPIVSGDVSNVSPSGPPPR